MKPSPRAIIIIVLTFCFSCCAEAPAAPAQEPAQASQAREMYVTVGKSLVVDSPVPVERVSVANGALAEAVAVSLREIVINGKAPGETSLIVWQQGGNRLIFDLTIRPNTTRIDNIRRQLQEELKGQDVGFAVEGENVFLKGTVRDLTSAERAAAIVATLGKPVNLLRVNIPAPDAQILLKVRFADVDRGISRELGANIFSTGALNTPGSVTVGTFSPPTVRPQGNTATATLTDALNIFLFRPDLDLGATIRALQAKRLAEVLAEPNVLAINGKSASFLSGGEFPYPTLQGGGGGLGAVTIVFREFGIRLTFLPNITPRGTIRLQVTPEVSSLDFANGLTFQGFTIPGLATRRVSTEIELEDRQSFAIAGLLDNRVSDTLAKIPGLANIPLLGKIFQTHTRTKNNTELLVFVSPELVRPIPAGQKTSEIKMPVPFLEGAPTVVPRTPGTETTGQAPPKPPRESIPIEQLIESQKATQSAAPAAAPPVQYVPVLPMALPQPQPQAPPSPPAKPQPPQSTENR